MGIQDSLNNTLGSVLQGAGIAKGIGELKKIRTDALAEIQKGIQHGRETEAKINESNKQYEDNPEKFDMTKGVQGKDGMPGYHPVKGDGGEWLENIKKALNGNYFDEGKKETSIENSSEQSRTMINQRESFKVRKDVLKNPHLYKGFKGNGGK